MISWPLALIVAIAVLASQLNVHFPHALKTEGASEQLIYLAFLLMIVIIWGFRGRELRLKPMAIAGIAWLSAISALVVAYSYRDDARAVLDRFRGEVSPTLAIARAEGVVELRKAWDGHFRAVTEVNGAKVGMLIDTGASIVLLSYEDAEAAGLDPANMAFRQPVITANGRAHVAPITLEYVAVGNVGLQSVKAAVAENGKLHSSLLGMSFLGRLQETSFRRDVLVLKN